MENQPGESVVVSLPSSPGNRSERSAAKAPIRQLSSTVTNPIRQLWSTVIYLIPFCWTLLSLSRGEIYEYIFNEELSPIGYILLGTLYLAHIIILLPITFTWKLLRWKLLIMMSEMITWEPDGPILSWEQIFVISCIAVWLDPFFLYIPIINQENKCLGVDKKLKTTLLVLRSLTDFASVLHIVAQVRYWTIYHNADSHFDTDSYFDSESEPTPCLLQKLKSILEEIHERMPWLSVSLMIDFLAVLPIPQVAIVVVFSKIGGSKFFLKRTILNVLLIFQYVPKACKIYLSSKKLRKMGIWVKGAFNFFLYILAGHVLASFWYFFAIQRETACWQQTCKNVIGCMSPYECGDSTKNISLLNELCPINSINTTVFDFGIYLDILQSGNTRSINFPRKFFYSLWWGIKNLSSFGTILETSSHVLENCFAILVGLIGLLLFLYLIGNVQTYIQLATTKSVQIEKAEELRRTRINMKYREMKMWMSSNGLPKDLKRTTRKCIKQANLVEKHIDATVDLEFLNNVLPHSVWRPMVDWLKVNALKKVPIFESVSESTLKHVCGYLYSVTYTENSYIVGAGEECDLVVFILDGVIELTDTTSNGAEKTGSSSTIMTKPLEKGQYYGEELLNWASLNCQLPHRESLPRPISTRDVKCRTKVDAFCIGAYDSLQLLRRVSRHYKWRQNKWVKRTLIHDNTDETPDETESEESKQMRMKNMEILDKGREEPREDVAVTGASTSTTVEQRLEQMLCEQLVLVRQIRDDMATQGRRLDDMAAFLARLGYPGTGISAPPAPSTLEARI